MNQTTPMMLLRARPKPEARARFADWFRDVHLRDIQKIPGIISVETGTTSAGTKLGFYAFESSEVVQAALSSPQAAYARATWQVWTPHLDELQIEIFAPLFPLPIYQTRS
ncbi:MAG: hypothetical protein ACRDG3_07190 [Tepidiformaceae bacterium]